MQIFTSVVVEISPDIIELIPEFYADSSELDSVRQNANASKAMFLQTQFTLLSYEVTVKCVSEADNDLLKISGTWEKMNYVFDWLHNLASMPPDEAKNLKLSIPESQSDTSVKTEKTDRLKTKRHKSRKAQRGDSSVKRKLRVAFKMPKTEPSEEKTDVEEASCDSGDNDNLVVETADRDNDDDDETTDIESESETSPSINRDRKGRKRTMDISINYKCEDCEYSSPQQRYLVLHRQRRHGAREHQCPICPSTFGVAKDLQNHVRLQHGSPDGDGSGRELFCCEHCGKTLKSRYALAFHISRIHNGAAPRPVKRYLCTLCGRLCRNRTDYNKHRNKEHLGTRPFTCSICNAGFFARANLQAHQQVHMDTRRYKCEVCDKSFKQRQGLRLHEVVHATEKPFCCERCSKMFTQKSALIRHARTHTMSRPFVCQLCNATFNDCSVLRRHAQGVHKVTDVTELRMIVRDAVRRSRSQPIVTDQTQDQTPMSDAAVPDPIVVQPTASTSSVKYDGFSAPLPPDMRIDLELGVVDEGISSMPYGSRLLTGTMTTSSLGGSVGGGGIIPEHIT